MRLLAACPLTLSVGCSSDNGLNLARVRGKVTFKGEPVKKGTVFFFPDSSKGTVGPSGVGGITDGSYVASTEYGDDGVIVGSHKVGLSGLEAATDDVAVAKAESSIGTGADAEKSDVAPVQAKALAAKGARRVSQTAGRSIHRRWRQEVAVCGSQEAQRSGYVGSDREDRTRLEHDQFRYR